MDKIVFATNNKHKIEELRQIVGDKFQILGLSDIGCTEDIPETGSTLEENALIKARYVSQNYGIDCFADDTGLEVDALDGAPGVKSARYAGPGHDSKANMELLLKNLSGINNRSARFRTVIALIRKGQEELMDGIVEGEILREPVGDSGFGYDPVFRPAGWSLSFAQATPEQKNAISHRGRATAKLLERLKKALPTTLVTILLLLFSVIGTNATNSGWYKFPLFADNIEEVIETSNKVYYLSGGSLFSFSPEDDETYAYSNLNKLSGVNISGIYYNYDGKYLAVSYEDGNIDILYDNGRVVNLPEIRDTQVVDTKIINHITFGDGYIVVATNFGVVIYRDDKMEVKESSIFNVNIEIAAVRAGRLLINYNPGQGGHQLFWAPMDKRHSSLEDFASLGSFFVHNFVFFDDTSIIAVNKSTKRIFYAWFTFSINRMDTSSYGDFTINSKLYPCADGFFGYSDSNIYTIKSKTEIEKIDLPDILKSNKISFSDSMNVVWAGNASGLGQYDISDSSPTVLYDRFTYADAVTCNPIGYMRWSNDGNRLYLSNLTVTNYKSFATVGDYIDAYQTTNVLENGYVRDISLMEATLAENNSIKFQTAHGNTRMYGDPAWMIEDPDNPEIYYQANYHEGLFVLKYNKETDQYEQYHLFNSENSPITYASGTRCQDVNIDPQGNLWVGYLMGNRYSVLPAAKRKQDLRNVAKSDWVEHTKLANCNIDNKDMMSVFCKKSNMMFVFSGKYESGIVAIDTKGTYSNPADDVVLHWTTFVDQDGNEFTPVRISFALEDRKGRLWIGTSSGVFEITNPTNATNRSMTVRRIKVPRNDGTNYADYLLDTDMVYWMSEDPAGRKWIATDVSGLFLVSETGDEILLNYTMDNSPLPTNTITAVECDPFSNAVYVGTDKGFYSFLGSASPAKDDYSEISAYPNPVRPEFFGDVTITGLMDNSVVKIADVAGNVVAHLKSQGGMASWNVCNLSGQRVKSGVYYVYATSGSEGTSKAGAVTKILVIN